jgi:hypothetical protein
VVDLYRVEQARTATAMSVYGRARFRRRLIEMQNEMAGFPQNAARTLYRSTDSCSN